jgi:hypothetical protein
MAHATGGWQGSLERWEEQLLNTTGDPNDQDRARPGQRVNDR